MIAAVIRATLYHITLALLTSAIILADAATIEAESYCRIAIVGQAQMRFLDSMTCSEKGTNM